MFGVSVLIGSGLQTNDLMTSTMSMRSILGLFKYFTLVTIHEVVWLMKRVSNRFESSKFVHIYCDNRFELWPDALIFNKRKLQILNNKCT